MQKNIKHIARTTVWAIGTQSSKSLNNAPKNIVIIIYTIDRTTNYNLYYAFIDDEKVVIRSIPYNENNVNIYEIGDNGEPRIVFHRYYKLYSCEKGHDKYDVYYIYDIYIPSISNSIKIDME